MKKNKYDYLFNLSGAMINLNKRKWLKILPFLTCLILVVRSNSQNLISNPGFETGDTDQPEGWIVKVPKNSNSCETGVVSGEFHSGKQSFKIARIWTYPKKSTTLQTKKQIPLNPQKDYILSFWYLTKGITEYAEPFSVQFRYDSKPVVNDDKKIYCTDHWQQYFILLDNIPPDTKNLELSFNTNINTRGSFWLDDIELREAGKKEVERFEKWRRQPAPEITGNASGRKSGATGFFRVEKADDRWWIINPAGEPTWAMAVAGSRGPVPGPGNPVTQTDSFIREFGNTSQQVNENFYRIFSEECGFNFFAGWTADVYATISEEKFLFGKPYLPMTKVLGLSAVADDSSFFARDREGNLRNKSGHQVVDPYNPEWRKLAREKAGSLIPAYRDKPWFFGWYVDNEMSFDELFRYIWADYSSAEFITMLEKKYGNINALNRTWSTEFRKFRYTSFSDILSEKPEPKDWDDPLWIDFASFERQMMKEYIDFTCNLVKELDPDHLVISNRINLGPMPDFYRTADLWGKYDIVCMNIYPDNNKIGFNPGETEIMKRVYEGTGRPVIIGEWSVPALDSKLYEFGPDPFNRSLDWSFPQVLRTQKERGEAYEICMKQLASLDFIIGAGWFITTDVDTNIRRANRGLMNTRWELYRELTGSMKKTHQFIRKEMHINQ